MWPTGRLRHGGTITLSDEADNEETTTAQPHVVILPILDLCADGVRDGSAGLKGSLCSSQLDEDCFYTNGSCMTERPRSRSPPPRRLLWDTFNVTATNVPSSSRQGSASAPMSMPIGISISTSSGILQNHPWLGNFLKVTPGAGHRGFVPQYAAGAVAQLPPAIKTRFPTDSADEMEFAALLTHCKCVISQVLAGGPASWYIGITACPPYRWGDLGHCLDYSCMYLLIVSRTSSLTRGLEEVLIKHYMNMHDRRLQNVDPKATGCMQGSPHFLYVCFAAPGPFRRRPR